MKPSDDTTEPGPPPLVRSITTETLPAPTAIEWPAAVEPLTLGGLIDVACDRHVAACLAISIATDLGADVADVWSAIGEMPDDSRPLLHSPAGHAEITRYVTARLTGQVPTEPLTPTIH